jgi:hypothetical protein
MKALAYYLNDSNAEQAIRQYAARQGLRLTKVLSDERITNEIAANARIRLTRGGIIELLDAISHWRFDFVIVTDKAHLDRTDIGIDARREIESRGVRVVLIGESINLPPKRPEPTPEKKSVSQRLLDGRRRGAAAGQHQSGVAPYGYRREYSYSNGIRSARLVIDKHESAIVQAIYREYLRRKSMRRLCEYLNENGFTTRRGKEWSRAGVSWILKNETYLGRVHFGDIRSKGSHAAIVFQIMFNKAQKLIRKNKKRGRNEHE